MAIAERNREGETLWANIWRVRTHKDDVAVGPAIWPLTLFVTTCYGEGGTQNSIFLALEAEGALVTMRRMSSAQCAREASRRLMSPISRICVGYPLLATASMARPIRSVVVIVVGATLSRTGTNGFMTK
jgi:hypothetical protein